MLIKNFFEKYNTKSAAIDAIGAPKSIFMLIPLVYYHKEDIVNAINNANSIYDIFTDPNNYMNRYCTNTNYNIWPNRSIVAYLLSIGCDIDRVNRIVEIIELNDRDNIAENIEEDVE